MTTIETIFLGVYFSVLLVLAVYGSHRYRMAFLYYRHKFKLPTPRGVLTELPKVTIQLPIFNEMYVVERLVDSVCRIDRAPGTYQYKFVVDGDWIVDPGNPTTAHDGRGNTNSVMVKK